jgi:hypothetical protein
VESEPPDFEGIVTGFTQHDESELYNLQNGQRKIIVWNFLVSRRDPAGYEINPPIPIEMRSYSLSNMIQNGDRVRIPYAWKVGQVVQAERVYNMRTESWVTVWTPDRLPTKILIIVLLSIVAVVVLALFVVIGIAWTSQSHTVSSPSSTPVSTPQQTLQDACSHFGSGDMWHQDMTANYRHHKDLPTFLKQWDVAGPGTGPVTSCDPTINTPDGNSVTGTIVVQYFYWGFKTYNVTLIKESDGVWRIDQLTLQ